MLIDVDNQTKEKWNAIATSIAELVDVPVALVMQLEGDDIKVAVSSSTEGNPYKVGDHEHFENSGLYCETVIKTQDKLCVPNALQDINWDHNPDIKLNMISYLGFPVNYPDGTPFGTFCILDNKENHYSAKVENVILQVKGMIEDHLLLLLQRARLLHTLQGIIPVCAGCKKVRNESDEWIPLDRYIIENSNATISHGMCPGCAKDYFGQYAVFQ